MSVSREEVLKIARLAELDVDDASASALEGQLSRILDYVAQLGALKEAAPVVAGAGSTRLRKDVPDADRLQRPPAEWSPAFTAGLFTVPKLGELDRGEDE